jgi:Rrf2 family protein
MYVTREADYAVRCILYLSKKPQEIINVNEISKFMHVPKSFLAKILQSLVKSGIVKSTRGIKGGFQLLKKPRDIALLDVIEAIQGPSAANICAIDKKMCSLSSSCAVHPIWVEIRKDVENRLKRENFEKLITHK